MNIERMKKVMELMKQHPDNFNKRHVVMHPDLDIFADNFPEQKHRFLFEKIVHNKATYCVAGFTCIVASREESFKGFNGESCIEFARAFLDLTPRQGSILFWQGLLDSNVETTLMLMERMIEEEKVKR